MSQTPLPGQSEETERYYISYLKGSLVEGFKNRRALSFKIEDSQITLTGMNGEVIAVFSRLPSLP